MLKKDFYKNLQPLGIVFGDIGTSPIYTISLMAIILKQKDPTLIMGGISLVLWLIILVVYLQYVLIVMNLSKKGEGGQLIIREYVLSLIKNNSFLKIIVSFFRVIWVFCSSKRRDINPSYQYFIRYRRN